MDNLCYCELIHKLPSFSERNIMTHRHRLYLDFDGVLNADDPQHSEVRKFTMLTEGSINFQAESPIVFSPNVVEYLDKLRDQYDMELVWLTTWNENNLVLGFAEHLKGLDHGRVIPANLHTAQVGKREWTQWKAEAILADQAADPTPFVWVDDNAHEHWGDEVNAGTTVPSLHITPNSTWGLTRENLEEMEAFLSQS
jgi:hypothetical protein